MLTGFLFITFIIFCVRGQTNDPSQGPTNNPSQAPTPNYYSLEYDSCVIGGSIGGGGMTLSLSRNTQYGIVQIEMKGPVNRWIGFGFGDNSMQGTYAIISYNSSLNGVFEYRLGLHKQGTMLSDSLISVDVEEIEGTRIVTVIRPYKIGNNYYDFTAFMSATQTEMEVISASGVENDITFSEEHQIYYIGQVTTQCSEIGGSPTPSPVPIPAGSPTESKSNITNYLFAIAMGIIVYISL